VWGPALAVVLLITGVAGAYVARRGHAKAVLVALLFEFGLGTYLIFRFPSAPSGTDGDMMVWGMDLLLFAAAVAMVWAGTPRSDAIW
jgi:hypothetical protein